MRIFITGGTGFIGKATIEDLKLAGHDVLALARSDSSATDLKAMGVVPHRGDLSDAESLIDGARQCDGVIHLAFDHKDLRGWAAKDREVTATFADALADSEKPLVTTSVVAIVKQGVVATELDMPSWESIGGFRTGSEEMTREAAGRGVRSSIVRLPPTVHGPGDGMFVAHLIGIARRTGISAYIEDGSNRWPAVHRLDTARLFRLAAERADPGECFHAVADGAIPFKAIADIIGQKLGVPIRSIEREGAVDHFGWLAHFAGMDSPATSDLTRRRLGWEPQHPSLLDDLAGESYFSDAAAGVVDITH